VLDGRDDVLLHGDDGFVKQSACEVRIVAEPLPIAAAANDSSETSTYGSKGYVGAFALELGSKVVFCLVDEFLVPGGAEVEARWVTVDSVRVANAIAIVDQAKTREAESWDTARDTRASGG
jgi:hypothetical protein